MAGRKSVIAVAARLPSVSRLWVVRGLLAVLDQGLVSGSNFVIGVLLARWLVPEQYGAYALAFSLFLFFSNLEIALLLDPMSILGAASYRDCIPAYVGRVLELHLVLSCVLCFPLAVAAVVLQLLANQVVAFALLGASVSGPFILFFWLCRRAAYLGFAPRAVAASAALYCGSLACLFVLMRVLGWLSPAGAFFIQAGSATVAAIPLLAPLNRRLNEVSGPARSTVMREHWQYGRWAMATVVVYWLSNNAYYVLAAGLLGMEDVAALRALQNFILPFGQLTAAISLLLLPWGAARVAEGDRVRFRLRIQQVTMLLVAVASAYVVVLWLFGERFMNAVYGGRYVECAGLLPLVAAPVLVIAASHGSSIGLLAMQSPADVFRAHCLAGLVTAVAGVPLTRYWGLVGAGVGMFVSSLTFLVVTQHYYEARVRGASRGSVSLVDRGARD